MTITEFNRYLEQRSSDELARDLADLFKALPAVREYYGVRLGGQAAADVLATYKEIVKREFFPEHGYGNARLSVARKAITDYRKLAPPPANLADLMVFYVEMGVAFTNAYGDIDERFYNSMESMCQAAAELVVRHGIQDEFATRFQKIVFDSRPVGWGFHDALAEIYAEHFEA